MRVRLFVIALLLVSASCCGSGASAISVLDGDIVFQTSRSAQSQAIQAATHSPYSHMGLVFVRDGEPFVLEAAGHVQLTPLNEWVQRGESSRYVVKRLRGNLLANPSKVSALVKAAMTFEGRAYDSYFEWSDERIYCSELVWKAYDRGVGVQLGTLARLSTFDLSSEVVKTKLAERYGDKVPSDELVISPAAVFASPLLTDVK